MTDYVDVALNLPVDSLFTYAIPRSLRGQIRPGIRVRVPFQSRKVGATCIALREEPPQFDVRPLLDVVDEQPVFSRTMIRLARRIARRYGCSHGEALDAALPFAVRTAGRRRSIPIASLVLDEGEVASVVDELNTRFPKQARTLRILADAGEPVEVRDLCRRAKVSDSPVMTLRKKGMIRIEYKPQVPDTEFSAPVPPEEDKILTPYQQESVDVLSQVVGSGRTGAFLLLGVTSSGKTEVYLRVLREVVSRGRQGIVLVPEIALTPQTVSRFRARFDRVAVLHSQLTDRERHAQWQAIRSGEADVVIGARSAIFAPTPDLGIIIIDEEHESTFKQQNSPRYDAREVARARMRFEGAVLLLGSATPSLETYERARGGRIGLLELPERVGGGVFPETIVADLGQSVPVRGRSSALTDRLRAAMIERIARKEQVILFLNRRGYATSAICRSCGSSLKCDHCDIVLVYHQRIKRVLCHYCGHERTLPRECNDCQGVFRLAGYGTERIEQEVTRALPESRVERMDSDTMKGRGSHEKVLTAFREGKVDVLVGTQMIAKGLDFPNVTLVGVISADTVLNLPDYRAAERTFGLVSQVAGRAGRSDKGGTVIVQTRNPDHFAIRIALNNDYKKFAAMELDARKRDGYPPFGQLARVVVQGPDAREAQAVAIQLGETLKEQSADSDLVILGPAPAPIAILSGQHRFHMVAKAKHRSGIRRFVKAVRSLPRPKGTVRVLLDVDPHAML